MENPTNKFYNFALNSHKVCGFGRDSYVFLKICSLSYQTHTGVWALRYTLSCALKILSWTHHMVGGILVPQPGIASGVLTSAVREVHYHI